MPKSSQAAYSSSKRSVDPEPVEGHSPTSSNSAVRCIARKSGACVKKRPSKHKRRRDRREQYYEMIDSSLPEERHFAGRIIDAVNRDGLDIAHDGRPIKVYWRHYLKTRDLGRNANAKACLYLLDKTFRSVRPKVYL